MNPYRKPSLSVAALREIDRVVECHSRVRSAEKDRELAAQARGRAVTDALAAGASLRDIAAAVGVSPETVRKMGQMDTPTVRPATKARARETR